MRPTSVASGRSRRGRPPLAPLTKLSSAGWKDGGRGVVGEREVLRKGDAWRNSKLPTIPVNWLGGNFFIKRDRK